MNFATRIRPISVLKSRGQHVIRDLAAGAPPVIVTVHGEAKAVLQGIAGYEQTQETLALLKILALGQRSVAKGRVSPARVAFARLRRGLPR